MAININGRIKPERLDGKNAKGPAQGPIRAGSNQTIKAGSVAGKKTIQKKPVAQSNIGGMQVEARSSTTGGGGGSKRH
jgi:hypothetical protein